MANSGGWVLPVTQQPGDPANSAVQQPPAYGVPGQTLGMATFGGPLGLNCLAQVRLILTLAYSLKFFKLFKRETLALLALTCFFFFLFSLLKNLFFYTSYLIIRDLT